MWRGLIERALVQHPIQLRAIAHVPTADPANPDWADRALAEITEVRAKLDAMIERLG